MKENRIDVIIPAFKAHKTILKTLCSIVQQSILEDIDITIVNDGCPEGDYHRFVDMFSEFVTIKELSIKNSGPAVARQYGIDHTEDEFIVFIDADDAFYGSRALELMRSRIQISDNFQCCSTHFQEVLPTTSRIVIHQQDMIWLFGKIYRRSFLDEFDIRFIDSRASNQDTGFNELVKMYCNDDQHQLCFSDDCTYTWNYRESSITVNGDYQYIYDMAICGYIDNMIYVADHVKTHNPDFSLDDWALYVLTCLYTKYNMVCSQNPIFKDQCWYYIRKFYHRTFLKVYSGLPEDYANNLMFHTINEQNQLPDMENVIPRMSIYQFIAELNGSTFNEMEIESIRERLPKEVKDNNKSCGMMES